MQHHRCILLQGLSLLEFRILVVDDWPLLLLMLLEFTASVIKLPLMLEQLPTRPLFLCCCCSRRAPAKLHTVEDTTGIETTVVSSPAVLVTLANSFMSLPWLYLPWTQDEKVRVSFTVDCGLCGTCKETRFISLNEINKVKCLQEGNKWILYLIHK